MPLPVDGKAQAKARAQDKERLALIWLYQWGFSTRRLIALRLQVSPTGQGGFFSRMIKRGLIVENPMPLSSKERLLGLTKEGADLASSFGVEGRFRRKPPTLGILAHYLSLQFAIMRRIDNVESVTPEWIFSEGKKGKNPDAVIVRDDATYALEVELSHKNNTRIYYNYLCHLRNIQAGSYQWAEYVFTNGRLKELYEQKFLADEWPVIVADDKARLKVRPDTFKLGEQNQHLFKFVVEEGY